MSENARSHADADEGAFVLMQAAVLSSISLFDQKSSVLLGLDIAGAVFCANSIGGINAPISTLAQITNVYGWCLLLAAVFFLLSSLAAFWVIRPRSAKGDEDPLYWKNWPKARQREGFELSVHFTTPIEMTVNKEYHLGLLGDICRTKARAFRIAMWFGFLAVLGLVAIEAARFIPAWHEILASSAPFRWPVTHI